MEQKQLVKQMIDFCQASFNNTFNANALIQDQFERAARTFLDQLPWMPAEGRQAVDKWVESYKTGRENFKKYMDDSYKEVEELFAR